jgi:pimeloyl-ACP methyl ester carboxylesterase
MANAKINEIEIYYEVHGNGEPLLLIMGLGANSTAWVMQIEEFARHHTVIAFDNRDAGRSQRAPAPYSIRQMALDALGLLDHLGVESADVFGMSMGGMIAQELVLAAPKRVRGLVLGGTMAGGPKAVMAGPQLVQQWVSVGAMPREQAFEAGLRFLYSEPFIARNRERLLKRALENAALMSPPDAIQRQFMAVIGFNTYDRLHEVQSPALVLTGTDDKIVPSANSRIIAERIAASRLIEYEGAGHGFIVERAEETNQHVLDFLQPHKIAASAAD